MSKSNAFENDVLRKTFNNVELPWLPLGNFYVSLHTADPGEAGDGSANECAYVGYARQAVSRELSHHIKSNVGISTRINICPCFTLKRSEGKASHVIDKRKAV